MKKEPRNDLLILEEELNRMSQEVPEIPEGFHASWVRAMEDEMKNNPAAPENKKKDTAPKAFNWKRWTAIAAAAVILIGGSIAASGKLLNPKNIKHSVQSAGSYSATYQGKDSSPASAFEPTYSTSVAFSMGDSEAPADYAESAASADCEEAVESASEIATWQMTQPTQRPDQMIIRTVNLTLKTRDYDTCSEVIPENCKIIGGWVESASESGSAESGNRKLTLTLRIPADMLDAWLDSISNDALIVESRSETAVDVSENYQDTETRLATQKALLERLQNMVSDTASMTELLKLEQEIADTQYTIDKLQSELNSTGRQVRYSTVNITLSEIREVEKVEVKEPGFFERLGSAFKSGFEDFVGFLEDVVLFLAEGMWVLLLIAVIIIVIVRLIKKKSKASKAKAAAAQEPSVENPAEETKKE